MGKESLTAKIKRFSKDIDYYVDYKVSTINKLLMFVDFMYEYKFHGVYLQDYIQYEFYKKKRRERDNFIVFGKLLEIMKICNNPEHRYIFDEKPEFNKVFKDYIGREWLTLENATYEEFVSFISGKSTIFIKDPAGMFGKGVELISVDSIKDTEALYSELKKKKVLCEEVLVQCNETSQFNNTSANTMRVVTLVCADNTVRVMAAVMRIGRKGKYADNFHHNGIAALIDVETGIIKTTGVDREFQKYVIHPDSGKEIVGFKVPMWDKIIDTVKQAALVVPDMRYIGWDVAVNDKHEIVLIEGNPGADPDVTQIPDQVGRWYEFKPYLDEISASKV